MDRLLEAIDEREAAAQTIVARGFALPHAVIDWDGDYRVVLGRSRTGVEYGVAQQERVHLVVLFVVGRARRKIHVELLSALAELFGPEPFRKELVEATNRERLFAQLCDRAGVPIAQPRQGPAPPELNAILVRQAVQLCGLLHAQALLLAVDHLGSVPWTPVCEWPGRLLLVTSKRREESGEHRPDTYYFDVPHSHLSRRDRANLGMLLAASDGLLNDQACVVCVTGPGGRYLDSLFVERPDAELHTMFASRPNRPAGGIRPAVLLRVLSLAIELALEGREGRAIGVMFVVGDTRHVVQHAHQLVLNPFHGFARPLRNILDPSLAETIKEFALIDGAFIIQGDGLVRTAGAYLLPSQPAARLPQGLGTRHQAAAAISAQTRATAITVSQSTGAVTVFRNGAIVFTLERSTHSS